MLTTLVVLFFGGLIGSIVVPILLGFAGAPGALLAQGAKRGARGWTGLALAFLGQGYLGLAWAALVVSYVASSAEALGLMATLVIGALGWIVAAAPLLSAWGDSDENVREGAVSAQDLAVPFTSGLVLIGYPILWFFPALGEALWPWVW